MVDPKNAATTASAAMIVPTGRIRHVRDPGFMVLHAHGTQLLRALNQANITNEEDVEALLAATVFTAQGYVLVAPNYAGFDASTLTYHPYVNADPEAKDVIDALTAARSGLPTSTAPTGAPRPAIPASEY